MNEKYKIKLTWKDAKEMLDFGYNCLEEAAEKGVSHDHTSEYWSGFVYACNVLVLHAFPEQFNAYTMKRMFDKENAIN